MHAIDATDVINVVGRRLLSLIVIITVCTNIIYKRHPVRVTLVGTVSIDLFYSWQWRECSGSSWYGYPPTCLDHASKTVAVGRRCCGRVLLARLATQVVGRVRPTGLNRRSWHG